jgi:hypothetical protein
MKYDIDTSGLSKQEIRSLRRKQLKTAFNKMSTTQAKSVMKVLQFDVIKETLSNLKNFKSTSIKTWRNNLHKLITIRKTKLPLSDGEFDIYSFLDTLISLLALFVGANAAFKCNEKTAIQAAEPKLQDADRTMYKPDESCLNIKNSRIYTACENPNIPLMFYPVSQQEWNNMQENPNDITYDDSKLPYYICPCEFVKRFKAKSLQNWDFSEDERSIEVYNTCPYATKLYQDLQNYDGSYDDLNGKDYFTYFDSSCPYIITHPNTFGRNNKQNKKTDCSTFKQCPCSISMCIPPVSTDMDQLLTDNIISPTDARYVIVEYDRNKLHNITVDVGQTIDVNDYLGDINGNKIKSKLNVKIIYKDDDIFAGYYITDKYMDFDVSTLLQKFDNTELESISELYKQEAYTLQFIKDYILFCRFPALASHSSIDNGHGNAISLEKYVEKYEKISNNIINEFNNKLKTLCSKDSILPYANSNNILGLKDEINKIKNTYIQKILNHYTAYNNIGYCTTGQMEDYMLYDYYMDYITNDNFYYDDQNPYIVKLYDCISRYLGRRYKLELNNTNISSLIKKFNNLCKNNISKYWKVQNNQYYDEIKNKFSYLYYIEDNNTLISADIDDKNRVTLFSKVYIFLQTTCNYTPIQSEQIEYSDTMDPIKILNSNIQASTTDKTFENALRKIALNFTLLRLMETSISEKAFLDEYGNITKPVISTVFTSTVTTSPSIMQTAETLNYIKSLQKITKDEKYELDDLISKAITWYKQNDSQVMTGEVFNNFKEIVWPTSSKVYWYNTAIDFYYLQDQVEDINSLDTNILLQAENYDIDTDTTNNYVNSGSGPNKYTYWLKYMSYATAVNCMMPVYWPTGLIIMGVPIPLPIIFIPFYVLPGRITTVFGLGICGICPLPLVLFINMSNIPGSVIFPLNTVVDVLQKASLAVLSIQTLIMVLKLKPVIAAFDAKINKTDTEIKEIDEKIKNLQSMIKIDRKTLRSLKKLVGIVSTSKAKAFQKEISD